MKLNFPATARNREPILEVLRTVFAPPVTRIIEVASGSGEHAAYFAAAMPWLTWQPTDIEAAHLASIDAWSSEPGGTVLPALSLDVSRQPFPTPRWDGVFCANMVHIAPWAAAEGLFRGAANALVPGGVLVTYGPYTFDHEHTSESNTEFDLSLKARDARWGVRDVGDLSALSPLLTLEHTVPMPANNFCLVFRRQ